MPIVARVPSREQLVEEHPCRFKSVYYEMFVSPMKDALRAAGCDVRDAKSSERGVIIEFEFPDGKVRRAIVDYADQVHIDGLVKFAEGSFDFVLKMKPCDRFQQEYDEYAHPSQVEQFQPSRNIYPYGYVIAPTYSGDPEDCRANREWFFANLSMLRAHPRLQTRCLLTRGVFHALGACPERQKLYDPEFDQGDKSFDWRQHMHDVARSPFVLNACGPDNTIDRKVVEFCAIGSVILSNDGLADLILPWGGRFVHGQNVWFVKTPADVKEAVATMPEATRQKLIAGSRALWDRCFEPASIGAWLLKCAMEEVYG